MHTLHCDEWVGADCLRSELFHFVPPNPNVSKEQPSHSERFVNAHEHAVSMWTAEMQGSNPPVFGDEFINRGKTIFA